ncbi:MAG TPA: FAD-dependent oxidoreductase [Bryobacteraceae bacterium]|nr:FAD-dependent oxidoreductase [Bryobacteraceae bacterium]
MTHRFCLLSLAAALLAQGTTSPAAIVESPRRVPVADTVDVVVAGGGIAGVSAALEAAAQGRSVLLIAPRLYLGEDLADTMRLWLEEGEKPVGALTETIFSKPGPAPPLRLKKTLEDALTKAGVRFLLGCTATEILLDGKGQPAGLVMANRAGRQAVIAKVIVDATAHASVAEQAGAKFHPWAGGTVEFQRVVLGGKPVNEDAIRRRVPMPDQNQDYLEYSLRLNLPDTGSLSFGRVEQEARDLTYRPGQMRASARLHFVYPNGIIGRRPASAWQGFTRPHIGHFQPRGIDRLYVAGSRADLDRDAAELLMRPTVAEAVGRFIGADAARQAASLSSPKAPQVASSVLRTGTSAGEIREVLSGLRPTEPGTGYVNSPARALPILGEYDVVIIGGGTSGAAAAIGAGRRGAKVLVAEFQEGLGGTGTLGMIGKPYHGRNEGFAKEVPFPSETFTIDDKMEWYRKEIRKTGGEILFGVLGSGAIMEGNRVRGAVIVTPQQRGAVLAKVVIDATGNADVAVSAGAKAMFGSDAEDLAMQGAGLPTRKPASSYVNTDYLLVDENDMLDVWRALVGARKTMTEDAYDSGALIQTRERRRVVGEHILSYLDQIAGRTYPDSIGYSASDYDSHGYPSEDLFALLPHDQRSRLANHPAPGGACYTPYRCLLPRGLEGILVAGLGISMHRDASAMVRMQRDMANQGYAAGVAAAMTAASGRPLRDLDVRSLQRHLVGIGSLPAAVLEHQDSFPLPDSEIRQAVQNVAFATNPDEAGVWLAVILTHKEAALPLLRKTFETARPRHKLTYANLLAFLGVPEVAPVLMEALDAIQEWDPRILQGRMAEYAHLPTPIDTLILGLGRTGDRKAVPALLRKLETLDASVALSHHRAVAIALEQLADPAAAEPLARLLAKPGMRGHVMKELEPLHDADMDRRRRLGPMREITIARALYRCGDYKGLGEAILKDYTADIRGFFARHATAVLSTPVQFQ